MVVYLENRSFDNLYGELPNVEGLCVDGAAQIKQVDSTRQAYSILPAVENTNVSPAIADPRFPNNLPNAPFPIEKYIPADQLIPDLVHRWYQEPLQINGRRKWTRFVEVQRFAVARDGLLPPRLRSR